MQRRATAHACMHAQRRGSAGASRATQHNAAARRWLVLALGALVPTTALFAATNRVVLEVASSAGSEDNPTLSADHPRTTGLFELALRAPLAHASETSALSMTPHGRLRSYSDDAVARSQSYGVDLDATYQQPRFKVYGASATGKRNDACKRVVEEHGGDDDHWLSGRLHSAKLIGATECWPDPRKAHSVCR